MPFQRPGRETYYIELRMPGGVVRKSTGTRDKKTAKAIERAVRQLADQREWALLQAVADGRCDLGHLYDHIVLNSLDSLRAQLDDVDLEPFVDEFQEAVGRSVKADTVAHYVHAVRTLVVAEKPYPRSAFTKSALSRWSASYPGSSGTQLKAHVAMSQFAKFLLSRDVIDSNPMRDVPRPKASAPRVSFLDEPDLIRVAEAHEEPYRTLSALLAGTGIEVSVALALHRRDVDTVKRDVRAAGTKTHSRDRVVRVADWAWPYIAKLCTSLHPDAPLFAHRGMDRWTARDAHLRACATLGIKNYTQRDARHSYAVRAIRSGVPAEIVARQLGHANAVLVHKVYGRFAPTHEERDKWERIAAAAAAERAREASSDQTLYQTLYHAATAQKAKSPKRMRLNDFDDSRGGTRTRDPGIMSAVL